MYSLPMPVWNKNISLIGLNNKNFSSFLNIVFKLFHSTLLSRPLIPLQFWTFYVKAIYKNITYLQLKIKPQLSFLLLPKHTLRKFDEKLKKLFLHLWTFSGTQPHALDVDDIQFFLSNYCSIVPLHFNCSYSHPLSCSKTLNYLNLKPLIFISLFESLLLSVTSIVHNVV